MARYVLSNPGVSRKENGINHAASPSGLQGLPSRRWFRATKPSIDPTTETRLDGRATVAQYFRAFFEGKLDIPLYEIPNPRVIVSGDMAVLTYNLANYICGKDGSEKVGTLWNSTQVCRRIDGQWRVVHVHWSFTRHPSAMQGLMA